MINRIYAVEYFVNKFAILIHTNPKIPSRFYYPSTGIAVHNAYNQPAVSYGTVNCFHITSQNSQVAGLRLQRRFRLKEIQMMACTQHRARI